jgi:hypothetical protein
MTGNKPAIRRILLLRQAVSMRRRTTDGPGAAQGAPFLKNTALRPALSQGTSARCRRYPDFRYWRVLSCVSH